MRTAQTIEYSEAKRIIDLIVEKATDMQKSAVVAVADSHGELIAFARMDGAPISSIRIAEMELEWVICCRSSAWRYEKIQSNPGPSSLQSRRCVAHNDA